MEESASRFISALLPQTLRALDEQTMDSKVNPTVLEENDGAAARLGDATRQQ